MSSLAKLKNRLEAARVEQERWERETREQEEQELQRMAEEERRQEEEECARREQQRADEERKRAEEEEQVAEGQRITTDAGGEGLKETETMAGVTETAGESWETDIARLHAAADRFENCIVMDIAFSACYLRILHNCTLFRGFTTDIN